MKLLCFFKIMITIFTYIILGKHVYFISFLINIQLNSCYDFPVWQAEFKNLDVEFLDTAELINTSGKQYPVQAVALEHIQEGMGYIS